MTHKLVPLGRGDHLDKARLAKAGLFD